MSENRKILPVVNRNSGPVQNPSLKQASKNPNHEIQLGCGCGSASCDGCAGALGVKGGSEKNVVYRNVFIFTTIAVAIILGTYMMQRILNIVLN